MQEMTQKKLHMIKFAPELKDHNIIDQPLASLLAGNKIRNRFVSYCLQDLIRS